MLYTATKELSANDAKRLSKAENILTNLANLHDSAWLAKDLAFYEASYQKEFGTGKGKVKEISKNLGEFSFADNRGFKDLFFPNTEESCRINSKATLFLEIKTGTPAGPFGFFLSLFGAPTGFSFGPFYSKENGGETRNPTSLIFKITKYFFTRPYQYQAIYTCLVKNKTEFVKVFGTALVEDLSLLFSAPIFRKEIQNFDFARQEFEPPLFCQALVKNDIAWNLPFLEGTGVGFYKTFTWWAPELDAHIYLHAGNLLTLDSRFSDRSKVLAKCVSTEEFLAVRINDALKQMVAIAEFGKAIYSKVNNKIFLENF